MTYADRNRWLALGDAELLARCRVDTYRASGPGGQKRNKTSSAVRLRHTDTGLTAIAEESRSQHENKLRALRRLRMALALCVRCPVESKVTAPALLSRRTAAGRIEISRRAADYPLVVAELLDLLNDCTGRLRETAGRAGITTGQLSRLLTADAKLLAAANEIRAAAGLAPIRARTD